MNVFQDKIVTAIKVGGRNAENAYTVTSSIRLRIFDSGQESEFCAHSGDNFGGRNRRRRETGDRAEFRSWSWSGLSRAATSKRQSIQIY